MSFSEIQLNPFMRKILKEPLFHFLLLGALIFALYGIVNRKTDDEGTIIIDDFDINNIIASWEMQWKRLPTDEELKNLVQQNIKQEIFYQEALKMNLDHNDEIIKRRLSQKMQFLSNDLASMNEPSDEDIQKYYDLHFTAYLSPYNFSFYQIIFSQDNRNDPLGDAEAFMSQINNLSIEEVKTKGDALPFPFFFENIDADDLNRELGNDFSKSLEQVEKGSWTGPVQSGFGYHLIYLTDKTGPQIPEIESIKDDLLRDMEYDNQKKMNDLIFTELKKNYSIEFNLDPEKFDEAFIDYLKTEEEN
jgi:hypothetical protein